MAWYRNRILEEKVTEQIMYFNLFFIDEEARYKD